MILYVGGGRTRVARRASAFGARIGHVRLYLSSFRIGDHPEELVRLAGPGARVAVIANACDAQTASERLAAVERETAALRALGLLPTRSTCASTSASGSGCGATSTRTTRSGYAAGTSSCSDTP